MTDALNTRVLVYVCLDDVPAGIQFAAKLLHTRNGKAELSEAVVYRATEEAARADVERMWREGVERQRQRIANVAANEERLRRARESKSAARQQAAAS